MLPNTLKYKKGHPVWNYTEKVVDHFKNPRNVGVIDNPDGEAIVGSLACGDSLKFSFKLDEAKEKIIDAKFQTFGCASAIASASALTEMVIGKTIEEARAITNDDIVKYLGGLPSQKIHCSVMGHEVLEAAIRDYDKKSGKVVMSKEQLDSEIICKCFNITRKQIVDTVKEHGVSSFAELSKYSKAGSGCGACQDKINSIILECMSGN